MLVKSLAVIVHGGREDGFKVNPRAKPFDLPDEEALVHIENGTMQPHGDAAEKRLVKLREQKTRERIRLAEEWNPDDDERDDVPLEDRARAAEDARRMETLHNREQEQAAARQRIAKGAEAKPDEGAKADQKK